MKAEIVGDEQRTGVAAVPLAAPERFPFLRIDFLTCGKLGLQVDADVVVQLNRAQIRGNDNNNINNNINNNNNNKKIASG